MKTISFITAGLTVLLAGGVAQAGLILDVAHLLQVDPNSGDYSGAIYSTTGCCAGASLYVGTIGSLGTALPAANGPGPDSSLFDLAYAVPNGMTSFVLEGSYGGYSPNGTDLFFDMPFGTGVAALGASITAYLDGSNNLASSSADSTQPPYDYYDAGTPNGGLSFSDGGQTVTLSNYVSGLDDGNGNVPYSSFDLTVTSASGTPEPGTIWLMLVSRPS